METMEVELLTTQDRCDRCGAQAYVKAMKDEMYLLFCGHHAAKYSPNLFVQGFLIHDETYKINRKTGEEVF